MSVPEFKNKSAKVIINRNNECENKNIVPSETIRLNHLDAHLDLLCAFMFPVHSKAFKAHSEKQLSLYVLQIQNSITYNGGLICKVKVLSTVITPNIGHWSTNSHLKISLYAQDALRGNLIVI